jgi:hypothetical protein
MIRYRPRINCLIPNQTDVTSLYRAVGPMSKLKHHIDCEFTHTTSISWASLAWCDILFLQRPWGDAFEKACEIAVTNKIPIWIDFDDNLLEIPDWNPAKKLYHKPEEQKGMVRMLEMASCITTTTEYLKNQFLQYNQNVFIIPNAVDDYLFDFKSVDSPSPKTIINWRGSSTHQEDLKSILASLRKVQNRLDQNTIDHMFHFMGSDANMLKSILRFKQVEPLDPIHYFHYISTLGAKIQLVPLVDIPFNHAKSNIAWLEGIISGAVTIAPKYLPEFNRPGCLNYSTLEEFEEILYEATIQDISEFYKQGWSFVASNLRLSKVNKLRADVVRELLK